MLIFQSINIFFAITGPILLIQAQNPLGSLTNLAGGLTGGSSPLAAATNVAGGLTGGSNPLAAATNVAGSLTGGNSPLNAISSVAGSLPGVGGIASGALPGGSAAAPVTLAPTSPTSGSGQPLATPSASPTSPPVGVSVASPASPDNSQPQMAQFIQLFTTFSKKLEEILSLISSLVVQKNSPLPSQGQQPGISQLPPIMGSIQRSDDDEDLLIKALKKVKDDIKLLSTSQNINCLSFEVCMAKDIIRELQNGSKRRGPYFESSIVGLLENLLQFSKENEILATIPETNCVEIYQKSCPLVKQISWYNHSI